MCDERGSDGGIEKEASRKGRDEAIEMNKTWRDGTKIWTRSEHLTVQACKVFVVLVVI
jgi:hypothetical protein